MARGCRSRIGRRTWPTNGLFPAAGRKEFNLYVDALPQSPGPCGVAPLYLGSIVVMVREDAATNTTCFLPGVLTNCGTLVSSSAALCPGGTVMMPGLATQPTFIQGSNRVTVTICGNPQHPGNSTNYTPATYTRL